MKIKEKLRKGLSLVLAVAMVFGLMLGMAVPTAQAAGYTGKGTPDEPWEISGAGYSIKVTYEDGTLTIDGNGTMPDRAISDSYDLAPWIYYYSQSIKKVIVKEGITGIGNASFYYCASIAEVQLPDSLKRIGDSAFRACYKLESITIPKSVTEIGALAFKASKELKEVIFEGIIPPSMGDNCFAGVSADIKFNVPSESAEIYKKALMDTGASTTGITVDENPIFTGTGTSEDCWRFKSYDITATLSDEGVLTISGSGNMPDLWTLNDKTCPWYNKRGNVVAIVVKDGVTSVGVNAFKGMTNANLAMLPASIKEVREGAFQFCSSMIGVPFPEGMTSIGKSALQECQSLQGITIPSTVTSIGEAAFSGCDNLAKVTFNGETAPVLGKNSFYGINIEVPVVIPGGSSESYCVAISEGNTGLTESMLKQAVKVIIEGGTLYDGNSQGIVIAGEKTAITVGEEKTSEGNWFQKWICLDENEREFSNDELKELFVEGTDNSVPKLAVIQVPKGRSSITLRAVYETDAERDARKLNEAYETNGRKLKAAEEVVSRVALSYAVGIDGEEGNTATSTGSAIVVKIVGQINEEIEKNNDAKGVTASAINVVLQEATVDKEGGFLLTIKLVSETKEGDATYSLETSFPKIFKINKLPPNSEQEKALMEDKLEKADRKIQVILEEYGKTADNTTDVSLIANEIVNAVGSDIKVTVNDGEGLAKTAATTKEDGAITGTIRLTCGDENQVSRDISVNITIPKLPQNNDPDGENTGNSSGSSSGSSSSGSQSSTVVISPDTGKGNVKATAVITDDVVTILNVDLEDFNKETGAEIKDSTLAIDLSGLEKEISEVKLSAKVLEQLYAAVDKSDKLQAVEIRISSAKIVLDAKALKAVLTQAEGSDISLKVELGILDKLNEAQKASLKGKTVYASFRALLTSGSKTITDFGGGKVTVKVLFTVPDGLKAAGFSVWYVAEDGALTKFATSYDAEVEEVSFETGHFSDYVILYDQADADKDDGAAGSIEEDTTFGKLRLKSTESTKTSNKLVWGKVAGADGYVVYGAQCNTKTKTYTAKKLEVIKDAATTTYSHTGLKSGTYYKYYVKAYKLVDGKKVFLAKSKVIHVATAGGKYGNAKEVKVNDADVALKAGEKITIKASKVKRDKTIKNHRAIQFESSDTKTATVNSKGVITAKKAGTCYIYVYAQDGVYTKVKVTVKE